MKTSPRPMQVRVQAVLLCSSALFMIYLGTMASAYYFCSLSLLFAAVCLWTASARRLFRAVLLVNQVTAMVLIAAIAYRRLVQPAEELTLDISGIALIANILFGGPALSFLSLPLLLLLVPGRSLSAWFDKAATGSAQ